MDVVGHGTACAGIIHELAPEAEFLSVRVLGPDNRGKGAAFAAGLEWAIEQGASVVNLSLSSKSEAMFAVFHDLADAAYFANVLLVWAANNVPGPATRRCSPRWCRWRRTTCATRGRSSTTRSAGRVRGAGVDVEVAWRDGSRISPPATASRRRTSPGIAA